MICFKGMNLLQFQPTFLTKFKMYEVFFTVILTLSI